MAPLQKYAWFNLVVIGVTAGLTACAVIAIGVFGSWDKAQAGLGALGLLGLLGLGGLFLRKPKNTRAVALDERDRSIMAKATGFGFGIFWVVFVLASMGTWAAMGSDGVVPVNVLPLSVIVGMLLFKLLESAAILWQYGR
ncbi:MAG: hypothetical protein GY851_30850 [bacterium]|nr:hypothetical protein [bacterium]